MIVEIGKSISFRDGEAALSLKTSTKGLGPVPFKSLLDFSKKCVSGSLLQGDDSPEQEQIEGVERLAILGPFQLGRVSYDSGAEEISFRVKFGLGSTHLDEIEEIGGERFWFDVKDVNDKPPGSPGDA